MTATPHNQLSASILSANFATLGDTCREVLAQGVHRIHFDVMDHHYVPNLTIGPMVCQALREYGITAPIDVHLMIRPLGKMLEAFAQAGATTLTVHPECCDDIATTLQRIHALGCQAGLAVNPDQDPAETYSYLSMCDEILMMGVAPGFGGQAFQAHILGSIAAVHQHINDHGFDTVIAVDGGINARTLTQTKQAGASRFVVGSALFHGDPNIMRHNIATLLASTLTAQND